MRGRSTSCGRATSTGPSRRRAADWTSLGWDGGPPFLVGRLAWRLWRAGGTDERPTPVAEPYQLMIDGDWAAAAAEWAERGATYLRIEALAAGDEPAGAEALRLLDGLERRSSGRRTSGPSCAGAGSPACPAVPAGRPPPTPPA